MDDVLRKSLEITRKLNYLNEDNLKRGILPEDAMVQPKQLTPIFFCTRPIESSISCGDNEYQYLVQGRIKITDYEDVRIGDKVSYSHDSHVWTVRDIGPLIYGCVKDSNSYYSFGTYIKAFADMSIIIACDKPTVFLEWNVSIREKQLREQRLNRLMEAKAEVVSLKNLLEELEVKKVKEIWSSPLMGIEI